MASMAAYPLHDWMPLPLRFVSSRVPHGQPVRYRCPLCAITETLAVFLLRITRSPRLPASGEPLESCFPDGYATWMIMALALCGNWKVVR